MLVGCGGGASPEPPLPPAPVSASVALSPAGGTIVFSTSGGYGATFLYSANNAAAGAMANVTTIDSPSPSLVPGQAPSGTMLAAFEFTLNQSVTFVDWNELLSAVTIPSSVSTNGHTFDAYGYDLTLSVAEGYNLGTVSGTTISFGSGLGPVGLLANHTYLIVLMMQ